MSAVHGIHTLPASSIPTAAAKSPAPVKAAAPRLEFQETAQEERQEALSGRQEVGEGAQPAPGSRFSITA